MRTGKLACRATKLATARAFDPGQCSRVESASPTLTPEDLWKKLALEAGEDAITDAASVPVTQAERDLHEAGFDVKAERERANAWIGELTGESAAASDGTEPPARLPSGPAPEPPGPKIAPVVPIRLWRTAGLLAVACVALFVVVNTPAPTPVGARPSAEHGRTPGFHEGDVLRR
jgi:hypothetical protein